MAAKGQHAATCPHGLRGRPNSPAVKWLSTLHPHGMGRLLLLPTFDPVRLLLPLAEACDIDDSGEDSIPACLGKPVEDDVKQILASGIRIEVDISLHNIYYIKVLETNQKYYGTPERLMKNSWLTSSKN